MHVTPVNHAADCVCAFISVLEQQTAETPSHTAGCSTYHVPLTKHMPTREWLEMIASSSSLRAAGHEMRPLSQMEWLATLRALPDTNPLFVFRDKYKTGLAGVAGHDHSKATAALANILDTTNCLIQPPSAYMQGDVENMVRFILKHGRARQ